MTVKAIREKAKKMGVKNITRFNKENLIRVIQSNEGNSPCFRCIQDCWEFGCLWREECQG
jgi:hypothetical protein